MKIYILWSREENRPAITFDKFGALIAYLTKEQLQAFILHDDNPLKDEFEIRELTIQ